MPDQEKQTLSGVLRKIREIVKNKYDNNINDNILNVIADLHLSEQRILFKSVLTISFVIEDQMTNNDVFTPMSKKDIIANKENITEIKKTVKIIEGEIKDIDIYNKQELIKLKTWFVKALIISVLIGLVAFLIVISVFDGPGKVSEGINNVFEILKEIIG